MIFQVTYSAGKVSVRFAAGATGWTDSDRVPAVPRSSSNGHSIGYKSQIVGDASEVNAAFHEKEKCGMI